MTYPSAQEREEKGENVNTDKCACGGQPMIDTDTMTDATFIECDTCHRMCGGLSPADAARMWNASAQGGLACRGGGSSEDVSSELRNLADEYDKSKTNEEMRDIGARLQSIGITILMIAVAGKVLDLDVK